jgi:hypothetical protein
MKLMMMIELPYISTATTVDVHKYNPKFGDKRM